MAPKPITGYLKAVWPDFWGAFLKSGRPRGPGKAFRSVGVEAPHIFEGLLGPPRGRPDFKNAPNKIRPDCLQVPILWGGGVTSEFRIATKLP